MRLISLFKKIIIFLTILTIFFSLNIIKITATDDILYTIKSGDTLYSIAKKFSVKINDILKINTINNPDLIFVNDTIKIPLRKTLASRSPKYSFVWPVNGKISSPYGWRIDPFTKKKAFHKGLDIAVPFGSPVYSADDGKVFFCDWAEGYGKLIIIKHRNGSLSYYGHLEKFLIKHGEFINKGKIIALSGNSGRSSGPHLHFEIRIKDRCVNPFLYLNKKYMKNGFRV